MEKCLRACRQCGQTPVINSRGEVVDLHHCRYVRAVDALIEHAEASADRSFEFWKREHPHGLTQNSGMDWANSDRLDDPRDENDIWDGMYHRAMERLRSEAGVPLRRAD